MNPSTRRLLCWALGAAAATKVMACSRPKPDPPFVEGEIAPPGSPQLFQDTQSSLELAPADVELLRRLEGLRLLVRKKDGQLNYLSPATAEWRRMNGAVDWKAASGAKFDPESAPCARAA